MLRRVMMSAVALMTAIAFVGCGGSGSPSTNGPTGPGNPGGNSQAFIYLSGTPNPNYAHVWATVTSVDLVGSAGQTTNVYSGASAGGQVVDLASLSTGASAQYFMLTNFNVPAGPVSTVNVTVGSTLSVVPAGSTDAVSATVAGANGASAVFAAKTASLNLSSTGSLVLDFNLANWTLSGTTLNASGNQFLQLGPSAGPVGPTNMMGGAYFGKVSALSGTAPTQSFTLGQGPFTVSVATSSSTVLYNSDGSANPTLANGDVVDVAGTFDATTKVLSASAIIIGVGSTKQAPNQATGLVTADSLPGNTITLQENSCAGFMPSQTTLTVDVSSSTAFIDASGVTDTEAQFFGALTAGTSEIHVIGTVSGSTLTATTVQLVPAPGTRPMIVAFRGDVSDINPKDDTFTLTVKQWEGRMGATAVSVVTTADTQYSSSGAVQTAATFFAALTTSSVVSVRGTYDPSTSTLTAAIISTGAPDGGGFHF